MALLIVGRTYPIGTKALFSARSMGFDSHPTPLGPSRSIYPSCEVLLFQRLAISNAFSIWTAQKKMHALA